MPEYYFISTWEEPLIFQLQNLPTLVDEDGYRLHEYSYISDPHILPQVNKDKWMRQIHMNVLTYIKLLVSTC